MSSKITQSNLDLVSVGCVDTIADTLDVAVAVQTNSPLAIGDRLEFLKQIVQPIRLM